MPTSLAAALIRQFEGVRLTAYLDSGGVPTIGFGHTADVKLGDTCTIEQAEAWLASDAAPLFSVADGVVKAGSGSRVFSQAALVSFGYNCGLTSMNLVIEGKSDLRHYVHDHHGNVLPGLVTRRNLEYQILAADGFFVAG